MVLVGGHKNIADHQNDARVQEVAQFAVKQVHLLLPFALAFKSYVTVAPQALTHDFVQIGEKARKKLDLVKINSAQKQVVAGLNYVLVLETAAASNKETYEAHVYGKLDSTLDICSLRCMRL